MDSTALPSSAQSQPSIEPLAETKRLATATSASAGATEAAEATATAEPTLETPCEKGQNQPTTLTPTAPTPTANSRHHFATVALASAAERGALANETAPALANETVADNEWAADRLAAAATQLPSETSSGREQ